MKKYILGKRVLPVCGMLLPFEWKVVAGINNFYAQHRICNSDIDTLEANLIKVVFQSNSTYSFINKKKPIFDDWIGSSLQDLFLNLTAIVYKLFIFSNRCFAWKAQVNIK